MQKLIALLLAFRLFQQAGATIVFNFLLKDSGILQPQPNSYLDQLNFKQYISE